MHAVLAAERRQHDASIAAHTCFAAIAVLPVKPTTDIIPGCTANLVSGMVNSLFTISLLFVACSMPWLHCMADTVQGVACAKHSRMARRVLLLLALLQQPPVCQLGHDRLRASISWAGEPHAVHCLQM